MVSKNALRLVNDLLDNIAIFDCKLNLILEGKSLNQILLDNNINLQILKSRDPAIQDELKSLITSIELSRKNGQPAEIKLPNIRDEFILLPTADGNFFFGLKNKIIWISRIELDLQGRVKELECLYNISKESDASSTLEEFLNNCTKIIEAGFQYPDETIVNIELGNKVYGNEGEFPHEVTDLLSADILLDGKEYGKIKVYRMKGPSFLIEEENLLHEIAGKISDIIEKDEKTKNLKKQQKILKSKNEALLKMTEECYKKREDLNTFFTAIADKIVVIDKDFNIIMSNKNEIGNSGKCYSKLFNIDLPCENCSAAETFNTATDSIQSKEFNEKYFTLRAHPIKGIDGKVDRVLEVCRDITEQKRMESQLIQSYKLASLGKLVAGVAHEINNPNTFILGNLKILQESLTDIFPILEKHYQENKELKIARLNYEIFKENISVLVNDMISGANRTKKIVADLRNFAKKDEGALIDNVDLNELIKNNLNLTSKQIKKHAQLEIELNEKVPKFLGNINKLEQAFLNLVMNASEAIETDEGLIKIKTDFDPQKQEVILIITDNGSGMDENLIKNIFDPFFTTKREKGGIGLGLSITYGIIKDHNGKIEVNSKLGEGTKFIISIPVRNKN
ncbi:MAG: ATP-binding protein [Bacteroidetes bacterium]|nr:ATP-binding protein [Bacteroidota bacterium]